MDMVMDMDLDMGMEDMVDTIMGKDLQRSLLNNISAKDLLMLDMAMVMGIVMDMDMVMDMDLDMGMEDMVDTIMGKDLQRSFLNNISTKDLLMLDMDLDMGMEDMVDMVMDMVM